MMAVVKVSYTRSRQGAKATIRYILHRPDQHGGRLQRDLWGIDGRTSRQEANDLIDAAPKGSIFFRLAISPDPQTEDTKRDLHLRGITAATMEAFAARTGQPVQWLATQHADHAPHRHVHVLAVTRARLNRHDLQQLTHEATAACAQQRWERDAAQEVTRQLEQKREEVEWEL